MKTESLTIRLTASQKEALQVLAKAESRGIASLIIYRLNLDKR